LVAKEKSIAPSKPPREIALRVSDREKVTSKLHELVKQFGGEIVTSEENMLLVSLPTGSFSGFEKELAGLSLSTNVDKVAAKKQASGSAGATPGRKREEVDEKNEERAKSVIDQESRTVVRILLIPE
jgi:hypoxanthine-guanine phosphoribosyltransferase